MTKELNEYQILNKDVAWLKEVKLFLLDGMSILITGNIYLFFQREGYQYLNEELKLLWKMLEKLDDYLQEKSKVVEKTRKKLEDANGGVGHF